MDLRSGRRCGGALAGAAITLSMLGLSALAGEATVVHRVAIEEFVFAPATLEMRQGEAIEWINRDIVSHTATEDSGAWDTGPLPRGQSARIIFSSPGAMEYFCVYHPTMRGRVVVTAK